jgi:hypothetical protein
MSIKEKMELAEKIREAQLAARANAAAEIRREMYKDRGKKPRRSKLFPLNQIDQQF